ncbi:murein L,D-transpeptidase [Saccharothrix syringae]|uniref:Murein L,D-transpeptidase n=1 Tax=Saccharothrix syringae TaxID=103733 RepID=A0A5Q0HFR9_SACSY|nr:murein L,D-transpeptidase [Saccharothrix syringae]
MVALCAAITATLAACGGTTVEPRARPVAVDGQSFAALPEATTFAKIDSLPQDHETAPTAGQVLRPEDDVVVYEAPGGRAVARLPATQLGSPTWVPEITREDGWSQVLLPSRPNRSTGWVHTGGDDFERAENDYLVTVDLAAFRMEVVERGRSIGQWTVGTGSAEHPTPTGRTYIMASIKETVTTFSPYVLPLGAHSDTHETFGGGPGTVALHGWPDDTPFGTATSDGCVRVPDDALDLLLTLPLGTVVIVK